MQGEAAPTKDSKAGEATSMWAFLYFYILSRGVPK